MPNVGNAKKVPSPMTILRGHNCGVTALTLCHHDDTAFLVSGDESGNLVMWNLNMCRKFKSYHKLVDSRIQSLKTIKFITDEHRLEVLVVQSRDNGLYLVDLTKSFTDETDITTYILTKFPVHEALFSRGDSQSINENSAILAYPSPTESDLVIVRIINSDAQVTNLGTARRSSSKERQSSVFDIAIRKKLEIEDYLLCIAYEDGCMCIFSFRIEQIIEGDPKRLEITLIKMYDLEVGDFITAFDVALKTESQIKLICGSPSRDMVTISDSCVADPTKPELYSIRLHHKGIASIAIRPDNSIFTAAGWNSGIDVYSLKSNKRLATFRHHTKQVQCMIFFEIPEIIASREDRNHEKQSNQSLGRYALCCASMDGTISLTSIY